jgi:HSP20 family protein
MNPNHSPIDNLDQSLADFIGGDNAQQLESDGDAWRPRVDVHKQERHYRLEIELPGWRIDQVQINVVDNCLEVRCDRELPVSEHNVVRRERHIGHFLRCFKLPDDVLPQELSSRSVDGLVIVELPRKR